MPEAKPETPATFEDFQRVVMRVGRVLGAEPLAGARTPAYTLQVDFGPWGVMASSAQLTDLYRPEDLVGRLVVAVTNFPPRRIAGFNSQVLILGVPGEQPGTTVLLQPDRVVPLGGRVY
jgi:tRNA-binding protein